MSEELIQRNLIEAPEKMGDWNFYNIGATTLKALKGAKIIPDKDYEAYEGKKPDALIVKKPIIIAAIEYKTPQELRTEKQIAKAIAQEIGTAQILQAKVYIVTDGKKTFWINPATGQEILQEDGSRITLNFDKSSTECITLINKIRASINATNNQIKAAASVDPLPLAEKVWQDLWAVSGATPENCLYTFVEIFIFKYLSDLGVLKGLVKRIVCECKFWNSSVPKEKVHAFRTVVQDSGASLGLLISQAGFQSGAIEAANLSNVRLMTWNEFTDIIADKWTLTRLKQLKMESVPLSEYTSSFHFPFDDLKDEDVGRYLKACDKYRPLRTTCWEITRKDLKENDSLTDFWYKGSEFTTIESYLNFLSDQVMAGLKEFGEILANSNITIPPERLEKSYGYIYMSL